MTDTKSVSDDTFAVKNSDLLAVQCLFLLERPQYALNELGCTMCSSTI